MKCRRLSLSERAFFADEGADEIIYTGIDEVVAFTLSSCLIDDYQYITLIISHL